MDPQSIGMLAVFGGGFTIGLWYIVARNDTKLNMRQGMSPEGIDLDTTWSLAPGAVRSWKVVHESIPCRVTP